MYCVVLEEQFFEFPEAVEYLHVSYISEAEASLYEILVHTEAALVQMKESGSVFILGTEVTQLLNCCHGTASNTTRRPWPQLGILVNHF